MDGWNGVRVRACVCMCCACVVLRLTRCKHADPAPAGRAFLANEAPRPPPNPAPLLPGQRAPQPPTPQPPRTPNLHQHPQQHQALGLDVGLAGVRVQRGHDVAQRLLGGGRGGRAEPALGGGVALMLQGGRRRRAPSAQPQPGAAAAAARGQGPVPARGVLKPPGGSRGKSVKIRPRRGSNLRDVGLHHRVLQRQRDERQQHAELHHGAAVEAPHGARHLLDGAGLGDVPLACVKWATRVRM
jgi:hypothetical protein